MLTKDTAHFESVSEHARFDSGPGKFRIGLLVLSNDYVMERDFINMRPSDDVAIFTSAAWRKSPVYCTMTDPIRRNQGSGGKRICEIHDHSRLP